MLIPGASRQGAAQGASRTDDEGDHGCAVTTSGLEPLDELLDLPYLDLETSVSLDAQHKNTRARAGPCKRALAGGWEGWTNVLLGFL